MLMLLAGGSCLIRSTLGSRVDSRSRQIPFAGGSAPFLPPHAPGGGAGRPRAWDGYYAGGGRKGARGAVPGASGMGSLDDVPGAGECGDHRTGLRIDGGGPGVSLGPCWLARGRGGSTAKEDTCSCSESGSASPRRSASSASPRLI